MHSAAGYLCQKLFTMKYIFTCIIGLLPFLLIAQLDRGQVVYLETTQLDIRIPEADAAMMANIPREDKNEYELFFTPAASLYRPAPAAASPEENWPQPQQGAVFRMQRPLNIRYADLPAGRYTEQLNFLGRDFLVQDVLPTYQWQTTGQRRNLLGLPVLKATAISERDTIEAWYTPSIPVATGPAGYGGLPGLILEVSLNNGRRIIQATHFSPQAELPADFAPPTKGKVVTRAEMQQIREEKMREMGGSNGNVIRIFRN